MGEHTTAGGGDSISQWCREQLLNGYDVHVWDDGHDMVTWYNDCDPWGEGYAFNEIVNAINHRGVVEVGIVGYSHGGGSVYNLSKRIEYDGQTTMWYGQNYTHDKSFMDDKTFTIAFTSYIDAIENSSYLKVK